MRIAVLALQGAFIEHEQMLSRLGAEVFEVRERSDWEQPKDGLILPGGESTTQAKLLNDLGLLEPIKADIQAGLPVFGTCAGLILLADKIEGEPEKRFATMDIHVLRNAYGRQLGSFRTEAEMKGIGKILLPDYLCSSVMSPVRELGLNYAFYPLNEYLELRQDVFPSLYTHDCAVLLINYYGLQDLSEQISFIRNIDPKAVIIEDDVQAYFEFKKDM